MTAPPPTSPFQRLSIPEGARLLRVRESELRSAAAAGELACEVRPGRGKARMATYVTVDALDKWARRRWQAAPPSPSKPRRKRRTRSVTVFD